MMAKFTAPYVIFSLILLLGASAASATRDPGDFYGFWETQEPAGDTCVFNIKRGNRISSFYTGSASSVITQGRWEIEDDRLVAIWDSGHRDAFERLGPGALQRTAYRPGQSLSGDPAYETRAVRIDPRVPGSLGVQRDDAAWEERAVRTTAAPGSSQAAAGLPIRSDFNGYWKVRQGTGGFMGIRSSGSEEFYLQLLRNGTVLEAQRRWGEGPGTTGRWTIEDDTAIIVWPNGQRDVLSETGDGSFTLQSYARGEREGGRPESVMPAVRATPTEASQFFNAGDVRLFTMSDIRGFWVPENHPQASTYVHIEGWGRANRHPVPEGSTGRGEWRLFTDRVVVTWDNGAKDVIRLGLRGWEQDTFAPGVPATGTPSETRRVRRVDAGDLNLSAK